MTTRKAFTIAEKAAIVWRLEARQSNVSIAKEFDISFVLTSGTTISTIWKYRDKIQYVLENSSTSLDGYNDFEEYIILFFGKISGETADVPEGVCNDWLTTVWSNLRKGYKDEPIFNTDET
ncbi:hypothetical protein NQ318_012521, partial [Aromia moschata]